jgi:PAS domain S-box-containing protein
MNSDRTRYSLRLLLLEDNEDDATLCAHLLKKSYPGARFDVVSTIEEFAQKVRTTYYDVILSDYALGPGSGVDAFRVLQKEGRDVPFILVTGALNDAQAEDCVKTGITDYVLKDNRQRLPLAISRALEERELLKEHTRAERALKDDEAKFRSLADVSSAAMFVEQETRCRYANRPAEHITGYDRHELTSMNFWKMVAPESRKPILTKTSESEVSARYEVPIVSKQRNPRWLDVTIGRLALAEGLGTLITAFDISERKRQEKEILNLDPDHFSLVELPLLRCYQ